MPRTTQPIQLTGRDAIGVTYAVQHQTRTFFLTYEGKICAIRKDYKIANQGFKYARTSWSSEQMTQTAVKKYNRLFATDQFGYIEITNIHEVLHNNQL